MNPNRQPRPTRRGFLRGAALALAGLAPLAGCQSDRPFNILGYEFGADKLYDTSIHTVYVEMFHNRAFQAGPYRGMEVEITKAIIHEIESKSTYKVVSEPEGADTELKGTLISINKYIMNRNQQNTAREAEIDISIEVVWRDLRDGKILSNPRQLGLPQPKPGTLGSDIPQFDPNLPLPPDSTPVQKPVPAIILAKGRVLDELGETTATGEQMAINNAAIQIVGMMEKQWGVRSRHMRVAEQP